MFFRSTLRAPTEIISGGALNVLLKNIQDIQNRGAYGPSVPVESEVMSKINLTATPGASIAMFKNGSKLKWPFSLRDTPFDAARTTMQDMVNRALQEVEADELSPATVRSMKTTLDGMDATLDKLIPDMPFNDALLARRYIDELR